MVQKGRKTIRGEDVPPCLVPKKKSSGGWCPLMGLNVFDSNTYGVQATVLLVDVEIVDVTSTNDMGMSGNPEH